VLTLAKHKRVRPSLDCSCIHACRDAQLAKFEAYLNKEGCLHINCIVRPRSRMAYPMKKK
jgi:hypothetical protein